MRCATARGIQHETSCERVLNARAHGPRPTCLASLRTRTRPRARTPRAGTLLVMSLMLHLGVC